MKRFVAMAAVAGVGALVAMGASPAQAAIAINVYQSGADVIADASGQLDTAGLAGFFMFQTSGDPVLRASDALLRVGAAGDLQFYGGALTGPTSFGALISAFLPTSSTGSVVGVWGVNGTLYLPLDYVSGTFISGSSTFAHTTLASMGLGEGLYTYVFGQESVSVTIGPAAPGVPEPMTWALMVGGFGLVGQALRRRRASISGRLGVSVTA